jgi:hypothetical protein
MISRVVLVLFQNVPHRVFSLNHFRCEHARRVTNLVVKVFEHGSCAPLFLASLQHTDQIGDFRLANHFGWLLHPV